MTEHIYGIDYKLPPVPPPKDIEGVKLERRLQKWRRIPIPEIFEDLEFDENDEPIYNEEQWAFINQELDRIEYGFWFYNNGTATYITGLHYFYLQYWTLENGDAPSYRDCDRRYFYFQDYCESKPYIWGIIRGKSRRQGATSQATADQVKTAISTKKANCGIISKTGKDAKKVFLGMIRPGYKGLPIYLKPPCEDEESKTELSFQRRKQSAAKKSRKRRKGQLFDDDYGMGSYIDFLTTELNSYDSGRQTKPLIDEGGKWPVDVPIDEYWPIIKKTLAIGARRVGFALLPSTCNKMTKGGKGFKTLWDQSNHFKDKITASGLYRYFQAADDGYEPYIDEYGMSIKGIPTKEQAVWMKERYNATDEQCSMSARDYILLEISRFDSEEKRKEERRMMPMSERELFDYENSADIYDREIVMNQRQYLIDNPVKLRRGMYYRDMNGNSQWKDDPDGMWYSLRFPDDGEVRHKFEHKGKIKPANTHKYVLTVDPFKNTIVQGAGSRGSAILGSKLNPLDPENTGMPLQFFFGRPKFKREFHKQMLLAAEYWGCELCYESDIDDYIEFLIAENKTGYMMKEPESVIDPNRKKNKTAKKFGVKSGDQFSYAMMIDASQAYVIQYGHKIFFDIILEQLETYDPDERTKFDAAVAFQLFCVAISTPVKTEEKKELRKKPVIKTYQLEV